MNGGAEVDDMDVAFVGDGTEEGSRGGGVGEGDVRESASEGERFERFARREDGGEEAREAAAEEAGGEGGSENGGETLHGVTGRGGHGGYEVEAGVGAGEVAGGDVGGAGEEELDEMEAAFFWFEGGHGVGGKVVVVVVEEHCWLRGGGRGGGGG